MNDQQSSVCLGAVRSRLSFSSTMRVMDPLRKHLLAFMEGGQAYDSFDSIIAAFSPELRGLVPAGAERSAWQIVEHLRIALRDILDFSMNDHGRYVELPWPEAFWPASPIPPASSSWEDSLEAYRRDWKELERLVREGDLFSAFPWGEGQTLLREILLAVDHQSHHLGQLVILRRLL